MDLTTENFDFFLCLFCENDAQHLAASTIISRASGIKSLFKKLLFWPTKTDLTDSYLTGLKNSKKSLNKPMASRITESNISAVRALVYSQDYSHCDYQYAMCCMLQYDLCSRVSNILGQYKLTFGSFLKSQSTSDTFHKTKSGLITHVLFSGEKTQYNSRVVRLIDGKLITALTGYYLHRDEQFRYSLSSPFFEINYYQYSKYLKRAINSTSHSLRALSAQTYRKNESKEWVKNRANWKTDQAYQRYMKSYL